MKINYHALRPKQKSGYSIDAKTYTTGKIDASKYPELKKQFSDATEYFVLLHVQISEKLSNLGLDPDTLKISVDFKLTNKN